MMATLINSDDGVPLRLYYQLAEGHTADAEVIARASLAFVAGVREIAYILDPSSTVRVGIEGHPEGSLWEDLLVLVGKAKAEITDRPLRYSLALSALVWIMSPPAERIRDNWWRPVLDKYFPEATPEQRQQVEKDIATVEGGRIAVREKEQFYREIGRDTGIIGVGANIDRVRPPVIVPRSDFPIYSGQAPTIESDLDRTTVGAMRVIILSPVLEVSNRRWKFATAQGEFGAAVKDRAFLERIVAGRTSVRMRGGVELDVELETKERLINGVWTVAERNVIRVIDIMEPPASRQGSMFPDDGDEQ